MGCGGSSSDSDGFPDVGGVVMLMGLWGMVVVAIVMVFVMLVVL